MTDSNLTIHHSYSSFVDALKQLIVNGTQMLSEYWLAYTFSFNRVLLSSSLLANNDMYYKFNRGEYDRHHYNDWIRYTDVQLHTRLSSDRFLDSLRKYVEAIVVINKNVHYSALSLFDDYIDNTLNNILSSVSESPIFLSTNYEVVQKKDDTRLLRYYQPQEQQRQQQEQEEQQQERKYKYKYNTPLLMVYAPINRYHILDLTPDRSIVNQFVSSDFDVFLLDWGEQKKNKSTITDYINYIDDYIEDIKKITNSDKINLFGYSWGGVLSMVYTSLYNDKKNIRNLIVQSSQADFDKDNTTIAEWMRSFPADEYVEEFGEMHGHVIDLAFLMRNPMIRRFDNVKFALDMQRKKDGDAGDNIQNNHYLISLTRLVRDLFRVSVWLNNTPDIQGEFFREFAKKMYQQNLLIKGQMTLGRNDMNNNTTPITKTINLKDITVPLLNIVGTEDDLVGPTSSIPLNDVVSSTDKKLIQFPLGHVELCISSYSHDNLWPEVVKWLQERCL
jgi:polyhydroxyalkanoate synthase